MPDEEDKKGAYCAKRSELPPGAEEQITDWARQIIRMGHGKNATVFSQAVLDALLGIWGWCGVTQEQAIQVLTAQAKDKLPHQN